MMKTGRNPDSLPPSIQENDRIVARISESGRMKSRGIDMMAELLNKPETGQEPDNDQEVENAFPDPLILHREQCWDFILKDASPWYKEHLTLLGLLWDRWNEKVFNGEFKARPHILLATPCIPNALGDYGRVGGWGGKAQIRIRRSLLDGTHPSVVRGDKYKEGRFLFVADVLLHECIHQFQHEILGIEKTSSYISHGPTFRDMCNEIGEKLGLGKVRASKTRGKDKDLPSCSHWPHCVRPPEYYQGAYRGQECKRVIATRTKSARLLQGYDDPSVDQLLEAYDHLPADQRNEFIEGLRTRGVA